MIWRRAIEPFTRPLFFLVSRLIRGMTLGVRVLAVDKQGRVLLVEHTYLPGWYLPGGGVDRGETTEAAAIRELREEVGLEAVDRPQLISVHSNERAFRGDHVLIYRVSDWREGERTSHGEILNVGWFAPDALPDNTTPSTRKRIAEALGGQAPDPYW